VVKNAVLFVNSYKENAEAIAGEISGELEKRGSTVKVFSPKNHADFSPADTFDLGFCLGGDGTVLYAARKLANAETPILPIHLGTLGFLASVERDQWLLVYEQWLKGTARISVRCMLELAVEREGRTVYGNICLNDVVVAALGIAKLIRLRVKTEMTQGEFADLGDYRSDGLIVATPTGSTAYSMAAGGPLPDPEMEAQIISPICSFALSNRPLVLPSRQPLLITVEREQRSGVLLTVDGQDTFELQGGDIVTIRHSPHYARLITGGPSAYYTALKEKLAWGKNNA
jgi:NAD+ kinase